MTSYFVIYQQILIVLYVGGLIVGLVKNYSRQNQTTSASKITGL